jgi:ribosomal protein L37E
MSNTKCQRCGGTKKLYHVTAKCSDMFAHDHIGGLLYNGYVPDWIGGGDYVEFVICRHCGQVAGDWPESDKTLSKFSSGKAVIV